MNVDYLIIGGGIAGTTAAETIRAHDKEGSIAIISKESHILYSRVLLPKYIEGTIAREQVFLRTLEHYNKRAISFFASQEATIVDTMRKEVHTREGIIFFYKQLLISAGGQVKPWRVEGSDTVPFFRLQTIDDADKIREAIAGILKPEVIIFGGGFITLELLNAFVGRSIPARILVPENHYWEKFLDAPGSEFLEAHLERVGVMIQRGESVTMVQHKKEGSGIMVYTNRRGAYEASVLAVGIGLERELSPFTGIGIEVNRGIKTNEFLETAVKDIWAAGDIAEQYHPVFQKHLLVGNWNNAFLQGRAAGLNMAGRQLYKENGQPFSTVPLYAIDVLGLHVSFIGDVFSEPERTENRHYAVRFQHHTFYERFIMKEGRLVGAILMNKFGDRHVIERLIREQRDISMYLSLFSDASIDLSERI